LSTLHKKSREKEAADAYLKFLQSKGAPSSLLYSHSKFLDIFMSKLSGTVQTRKVYSTMLSETLESLPLEEKTHALNAAREFFPFWMGDIKAVAMFQQRYGFSAIDIQWTPKASLLKTLPNRLKKASLSKQESLALNAYIEAITAKGIEPSEIARRSQLTKTLLIYLREAPVSSPAVYRVAVDHTLPLFKSKEIKKYYLDAVREFYPFWRNDTAVKNKVIS